MFAFRKVGYRDRYMKCVIRYVYSATGHMEKFGKVLLVLIMLLPFHQSYGQDIKIRVLNYDYKSKRVTVKVENHSNDTIWYSLYTVLKTNGLNQNVRYKTMQR